MKPNKNHDKVKDKNYITPKGFAIMQAELNQLLTVERPEVTRTVAWAASNGDRSENADYIYGKKRLREIDKRVRFLTQRIDLAAVVDPSKISSAKVQFGASVKVIDEEGIIKNFSIVGVDEINTLRGHISWRSPIGSSLIGKEVGDTIDVVTPKGLVSFEIMEINYREIQ